ncbi:MAG TPA: peptidoglycan editing factor PgeF [Pyrinomonadaceae bacterium]|nr:peptidoglycan editing factor PgeF [Pyrinomonadaceae bacterium]
METITPDTYPAEVERAGFRRQLGEGNLRALVCEPLEREGFANAFSTRGGGVSAFPEASLNLAGFDEDSAENIRENRRRFVSLVGGRWALAACWQVHGRDVRVVRDLSEVQNESERCDALATDLRGVLLGVKTADCVPVLLGDSRTGACAAVHAGWRGTLAGIVRHALATLNKEFGTKPEDVRAAVGPAALACCYEVGPEVLEAFRAEVSNADSLFTPTSEGRALIDLHRANLEQLTDSGVRPERVHALPLCTICRPEDFFSYRRDKKLHGRTGRLLSVIGFRNTISG